MPRRNNLSEIEHTFHNIVPLLDVTIGKDNHYLIKYKTDPNDRARVVFKVDAIFEYQDISWTPVIEWGGCYRKTNRRKCKWYSLMGLTVVGRKIRVCALATTGGLFQMHECLLPTSHEDLINLELAYLVLKGYKK
ncbi:hypothetical protein RhiirA4_450612 [Rhizophagus irregularis]|uniref:Uncharacterized protein n=1 Tax=Rhizophagus irregularis TaxID=588596 RepID=A0A2I1FTK0_9GLOM|nr:hypothetical protein RhiirA4_450612 [Rhizophagus irregularis]